MKRACPSDEDGLAKGVSHLVQGYVATIEELTLAQRRCHETVRRQARANALLLACLLASLLLSVALLRSTAR